VHTDTLKEVFMIVWVYLTMFEGWSEHKHTDTHTQMHFYHAVVKYRIRVVGWGDGEGLIGLWGDDFVCVENFRWLCEFKCPKINF
jgi:hypothetical protein